MEFSFAINIPQIKYSNIRESIEKSGDFGYTHFKIRKLVGAGRKIRVHRERGCSPLFFSEEDSLKELNVFMIHPP